MTSSLSFDLTAIKKNVSLEAVARYFGGSDYKLSGKTRERIAPSIFAAADLTVPRAVHQLIPVCRTNRGGGVRLENGLDLKLPFCFTDSEARLVAAVIGTLGDGLEKHCRKLAKRGAIYTSTLFDAVGTAMLDLLSEEICNMLQRECNGDGLMIGKRFAPGINGYPLEQQRLLFQLVDHKSVGVFLNSSAVMVPTKSISFFLMMTEATSGVEIEHKCGECKMFHCQFRMNSLQQSKVLTS
jgi:hypothetical protein